MYLADKDGVCMFDLDTIDRHFPYRDENDQPQYREGQKRAIEFALNAFNAGKKVVIIEGPTGAGKSVIGMTLADMVDNSYYLTSNKILQDQIVGEFTDVVELKGRNAYPCTLYARQGKKMVDRGLMKESDLQKRISERPNCAVGWCKTKSAKGGKSKCSQCFDIKGPSRDGSFSTGDLAQLPPGMNYSACPYFEQVYTAINSRKVTMNFSSFLFQTQMTKRFDKPRSMLIIDEAHNAEPQIMDFVSLTISDAQLGKYGVYIPQFDTAQEYAVFFEDAKVMDHLQEAYEEASDSDQLQLAEDLSRTIQKYRSFMANITQDGSEWVAEYEESRHTKSRKVTLKPVYVSGMIHKLLFRHAELIVMMSATILDVDVLCRSLGVDRNHVAAIRLKNRFPVKNRPIYLKPVAKMTGGQGRMHEWMPNMVQAVNELARKYQDQRGIIHTHNFAIMNGLLDRCAPDVTRRFTTQIEFPDKKYLLEHHERVSNSIIVAPAMHEGIDLYGDLSRFQIVCKVPYANFIDNQQLARRIEVDRRYYTWLTAVKLVQSVGRSVRSETDYADTFILDEAVNKFLKDAKSMLPDWFTEALV
jgi:ATP-dependent DNA helicase DinG